MKGADKIVVAQGAVVGEGTDRLGVVPGVVLRGEGTGVALEAVVVKVADTLVVVPGAVVDII